MSNQPVLQKNTKVFIQQMHNLFVFTNKLALQLGALSDCDNFTEITILQ